MSSFFDSGPGTGPRTDEADPDVDLDLDPTIGRHDDDEDGAEDEDFIPRPPFRLSAVSVTLVALIILGGGFLVGVLVQKHHDKGTGSTTGGFGARAGGEGFGAGTFGGGEGFPAGGFGGTRATGDTGVGRTPVVIGTVISVSGSKLVVTNLGGARVTVSVPATATVTAPFGGALKKGSSVSVVGSSTAGAVTATSITVTG